MIKTKITYNKIWQVAYPIILGSVAQNIIIFTDTAFLGRVGEIALGASAIGGLFYLAVIMLGFGFGTGAQIIIARRLGEGKLVFLSLLAILAFTLLEFGSVYILKYAINSTAIYNGSIEFLQIRAFGIFFAFINLTFRAFYVGVAKTKVITYTTIVLAIVNIVLDYGFIFGNLGLPELGIQGAALASVIAEISAMIFFLLYTFKKIDYHKYNLFCFSQFRWYKLQKIFKVSIPMMAQQFISLSVWFVFFLFVEKIGETALAVSNIIRSIYVLAMVPIWGFATATNTLVSVLMGEKKQEEVLSLIFKITVLCFVSVLILVSTGLLFPKSIMEIYTNNNELVTMGIPALYAVSVGALLLSIGFVLTGKTNVSLIIEIIVLSAYVIFTYVVIIVFKGNVTQAWFAEIIYGALLSIISFAYLKTNKWQKSSI